MRFVPSFPDPIGKTAAVRDLFPLVDTEQSENRFVLVLEYFGEAEE